MGYTYKNKISLVIMAFFMCTLFLFPQEIKALTFYSTETVEYPDLPTGAYEEMVNNYPNPAYTNSSGQFIQTFKGDGDYIQGMQFNMAGIIQSFYVCKGVPDYGYGDDTCLELGGTNLFSQAYNWDFSIATSTAILFTQPIKTYFNNDYFIVFQFSGTVNKTSNLYSDGYFCYANYGWNCEGNRDLNFRVFSTPLYDVIKDKVELFCPTATYIRRDVTPYGDLVELKVHPDTFSTSENWLTFDNNLQQLITDYEYIFYEDVNSSWSVSSATASSSGDLTELYYSAFDTEKLYYQVTSTPATTTRYILQVWYKTSPISLSVQNYYEVIPDATQEKEICFLDDYPVGSDNQFDSFSDIFHTKIPFVYLYDFQDIFQTITNTGASSTVTTTLLMASSTYGKIYLDPFALTYDPSMSGIIASFRFLMKMILYAGFGFFMYEKSVSFYKKIMT